MSGPLYTIGHSNHSSEAFVGLLRQHGVTAVADVRSAPHSAYNPQFNRETLATALTSAGIAYVFLGREFGARREEAESYVDGRVDFGVVAAGGLFHTGRLRLQQGRERYTIALMCAERDPLECHRSGMICRRLARDIEEIQHIRADGTLETQAELEDRLLRAAGLETADLFRSREARLDDAWRWLERRIAWRPPAASGNRSALQPADD
ncbi:MAG: DUF488 domain-containing protein [Planctomyces sp.]|nr:DUF488 domain-containing protein [Planctomyces sp.]